jgi:Flp pilus assembly pilin Flp
MINAIATWIPWLRAHIHSERGQDLIEYALLGGLIAIGIALAIASGFFTDAVEAMAQGVGRCIDFNDSTNCPST